MLISARIYARGLFLIALLLVCLANAAGHTQGAEGATTKVWVNTKSGVYPCPGTRWYGKTKAGTFIEQREAQPVEFA
jgi:hypothetical protein